MICIALNHQVRLLQERPINCLLLPAYGFAGKFDPQRRTGRPSIVLEIINVNNNKPPTDAQQRRPAIASFTSNSSTLNRRQLRALRGEVWPKCWAWLDLIATLRSSAKELVVLLVIMDDIWCAKMIELPEPRLLRGCQFKKGKRKDWQERASLKAENSGIALEWAGP